MLQIDRRAFISSLGGAAAVATMTSEQKASALEAYEIEKLNEAIDGCAEEEQQRSTAPPKYPTMAEIEADNAKRSGVRKGAGSVFNAGTPNSPRGLLTKMSAKPTLLEFFEKRFAPANHVLQSANRAMENKMPEEIIFACLLHDTVLSLIHPDHGWWGAQLYEPYVSEKTLFAVKYHQTLRFYPDDKFGYEYPESYIITFGEDYKPEPYLEQTYKMLLNHKWYEYPRLVTVNDLYSFDPNKKVSIDPFIDIIGRQFKQPKEGLGYDNSSSAHMWRTLAFPDRSL
jgi:hypothetical protein